MIKFLPYPHHNLLSVIVKGAEYDYAVKAGNNMSVVSERSEFGQSYTNTSADKQASQRTGRLGEIALGKLIHSDIDSRYLIHGDKYDFIINGKTIDIKTSYQHMDPYVAMYKTDTDYIYKYECDYYIFAYKDYDHRERRETKITFDGYVLGEEIRSGKFKIAESNGERFAYNYVIPYKELKLFPLFYHKVYQGGL